MLIFYQRRPPFPEAFSLGNLPTSDMLTRPLGELVGFVVCQRVIACLYTCLIPTPQLLPEDLSPGNKIPYGGQNDDAEEDGPGVVPRLPYQLNGWGKRERILTYMFAAVIGTETGRARNMAMIAAPAAPTPGRT